MSGTPLLTVTSHEDDVVFQGELAVGIAAIVDGDALAPGYDGPVDYVPCPQSQPESIGAQRLAAATARVLDAIPQGQTGSVTVHGAGALAKLIRLALGPAPQASGAQRPAVVIDVTGQQDTILEALRDVDDLGKVVLAGGCAIPEIQVDTYPDLHVRGIVLQGMPGFPDPNDRVADPGPLIDLAASLSQQMHPAFVGEPAPIGQLWYRVVRR